MSTNGKVKFIMRTRGHLLQTRGQTSRTTRRSLLSRWTCCCRSLRLRKSVLVWTGRDLEGCRAGTGLASTQRGSRGGGRSSPVDSNRFTAPRTRKQMQIGGRCPPWHRWGCQGHSTAGQDFGWKRCGFSHFNLDGFWLKSRHVINRKLELISELKVLTFQQVKMSTLVRILSHPKYYCDCLLCCARAPRNLSL